MFVIKRVKNCLQKVFINCSEHILLGLHYSRLSADARFSPCSILAFRLSFSFFFLNNQDWEILVFQVAISLCNAVRLRSS